MLARFLKLPALVLDFIEQPHIFDCNRSLVGKCGDQLDLLVGERLYFRARHWNTGSSLPGEVLITLSTSAVAVCC